MPSDAEPTLRGYEIGQRVFGRYTLQRILGRGGMGIVWKARDETLNEDVALKFLPDAVRWDPGAFDDLKTETRRARQLTHPNIVRIHDFVEDASGAAISMELIDGRTLTEIRLAQPNKVLEPVDIAPWLADLGAALDYAHQHAKVVHRDLKPTNIMLTRAGVVKVGDFGIARSLTDSLTRVSMMSAGTLVYMSPQQAMGDEPSPADDIYALGATLYELLAGKPPFHTGDVRVQLFQRKPDSINARRRVLAQKERGATPAHVPAQWEQTIAACLAKEAAARPATAGEVAAQLASPPRSHERERVELAGRRALHSLALVATSVARRHPYVSVATLIACLALIGWSASSSTRWFGSASGHADTADAFTSDATRAVAAWNFDGDVRDASGHGLHATASSTTPTRDRFGRIDRALHFNGNAGIAIPDSPLIRWNGRDPFSAAVWVRPGRPEPDVELWRSLPDRVDALQWTLSFSKGVPQATMTRLEHDHGTSVLATTPLSADAWHHLALVSNGRALTLYIDGVAVGQADLGVNTAARMPAHVDMRIGRTLRFATGAYFGDLDDARLYRRALSAADVALLAGREAPPRFVATRGVYGDKDDLAAAIHAEFGPSAHLADWNELVRWHADDAMGWADELELKIGTPSGWVQRGGQRRAEPARHYFISRFNGTKPDYFASYAELGGMTLALGSWYGDSSPALVTLPANPPVEEALPATAGRISRQWTTPLNASALQLSWRATMSPDDLDEMRVQLTLRGGRIVRAICRPSQQTFALTMGSVAAPERVREVQASFGPLDFTLVVRDGVLRLRATSVAGGVPVFDEAVRVADLGLRDVTSLDLSVGADPQRGLAGGTLILE